MRGERRITIVMVIITIILFVIIFVCTNKPKTVIITIEVLAHLAVIENTVLLLSLIK